MSTDAPSSTAPEPRRQSSEAPAPLAERPRRSTPDAPSSGSGGSGRGRLALKVVVGLVLALVWVRFVLFAWLFPIVERRFDSPEIAPAEGEEQVESLAPILAGLVTAG